MVKVSSATGGKNTRSVSLEGTFIGFNRDGKRASLKGSFHLALVVSSHKLVGGGTNNGFAGVVFAAVILSGVRIIRLKLEFVGLGVSESVLLETTIATVVTIVSSGTVNKLLLRERNKFASLEEVSGFESTSG